MRRNQRIVDTEAISRQIRETFHQSPSKKKVELTFSWPLEMKRIGVTRSIMYLSDKWGITEFEQYKHATPGSGNRPRSKKDFDIYVSPSVRIVDIEEGGKEVPLDGEWEDLDGPLPRHIAVLGKSLGVQLRLNSGRKVQVDFDGSTWGAAKSPDTGETFLVLFNPKEVLMIVTGDDLDVERDGIVGGDR